MTSASCREGLTRVVRAYGGFFLGNVVRQVNLLWASFCVQMLEPTFPGFGNLQDHPAGGSRLSVARSRNENYTPGIAIWR